MPALSKLAVPRLEDFFKGIRLGHNCHGATSHMCDHGNRNFRGDGLSLTMLVLRTKEIYYENVPGLPKRKH
jgi:hypothetical protein